MITAPQSIGDLARFYALDQEAQRLTAAAAQADNLPEQADLFEEALHTRAAQIRLLTGDDD